MKEYLATAQYIYRHLDWRLQPDWLGTQPYLMEFVQDKPIAMLICPPAGDNHAWIRSYSGQTIQSARSSFTRLLDTAMDMLRKEGISSIYTIALAKWYISILEENGFVLDNQIVVLGRSTEQATLTGDPASQVMLRGMLSADLDEVFALDQSCFAPLWQITSEDVHIAYKLSDLCSVAITEGGKIVGYQMSNIIAGNGHLARIGVHPEFRRMNIGQLLLNDLLDRFNQLGVSHMTLNTQADNFGALQLYQKNGFTFADDQYPLYKRNIP